MYAYGAPEKAKTDQNQFVLFLGFCAAPGFFPVGAVYFYFYSLTYRRKLRKWMSHYASYVDPSTESAATYPRPERRPQRSGRATSGPSRSELLGRRLGRLIAKAALKRSSDSHLKRKADDYDA